MLSLSVSQNFYPIIAEIYIVIRSCFSLLIGVIVTNN